MNRTGGERQQRHQERSDRDMGQGAGERDGGERVRGKREGKEKGRGRDREQDTEQEKDGKQSLKTEKQRVWIRTRRRRRSEQRWAPGWRRRKSKSG